MQDDLLTEAAALAYYASLSVPPILLLALSAMSFFGLDFSNELTTQVEDILGSKPATAVIGVIETSNQQHLYAGFGRWLGTILLFFTASAVMAQLQAALNKIYGPTKYSNAWMPFLVQRLVALTVVLVLILLALTSVILSVAVAKITDPSLAWWATVIHTSVSIMLFVFVFAMLFRWVPDHPPTFRASLLGGGVTAVLFLAGKAPLAWFVERSVATSLYGAASALMLLLVWVYYSSLIICLGAELSFFIDSAKSAPMLRHLRQHSRPHRAT
jgi:membrane protein